jgi:hypothetical protein
MLRRCLGSSIMAALSPAARWMAENGWLAAITRMRCWFGLITIPDEAISCVESGWASCMADVLKELDRPDRFDGPFMGPGRQRRYFDIVMAPTAKTPTLSAISPTQFSATVAVRGPPEANLAQVYLVLQIHPGRVSPTRRKFG